LYKRLLEEHGTPPQVVSKIPIPALVALFLFDDAGKQYLSPDAALEIIARKQKQAEREQRGAQGNAK
jgi:hypothetical protein